MNPLQLVAAEKLHISLPAEEILHFGPIAINNSLLSGILATILITLSFWAGTRQILRNPRGKLGQAIESLVEVILKAIEEVTRSRAKAVRYFPFLATLFIFILINNWVGLLPGVGSISITTAEGPVPLLRGANADLNTTLALAIISVVTTQVYAFKELGVGKQLSKYFSKNPIFSFVGVLEIFGEFSKMISFSFRLFGNIFAGEVLLVVVSALVPVIGPLPFFGLELFVGLVQALVFTMLSLVFLSIATAEHEQRQSGEDIVPST